MNTEQRQYATGYQQLGSYYDEEPDHDDAPPAENIIHVVPDKNKSRWNHIENLDEFFARVYQYHQRSGFFCMVFQDFLQLVQFAFVVLFSTFLWKCVDYDVLFLNEKQYNASHRVTIGEGIYPPHVCVARFDGLIWSILLISSLFFLFRLIKMIYNIFQYTEIRAFYLFALKISAEEMGNMTWHEVQRVVLEVQKEQQMCIHKQELTELDIYHRILRFKNYMIAMVNKSLLPLTYRVPFAGEYAIMTTGLKYNLEMILFWGPWAPFENYWHLKSDYKSYHRRKELADQLARKILWVGVANFLLCPLIFLWQILYSFFRYAEAVKREPGTLGSRRWSLYSRLYIRHFNELDHEFTARMNRAYRPADRYMNSFCSPLLAILAKYIAFFAGSVLAVLVILTLVDDDFLSVEHVLTSMAVLTAITAICHSVIPDEHLVWCPELLMRAVLSHIHYMPDSWKGQAHTTRVRDQFATLFQYKIVYLIEELFSPIITPLILTFSLRHKALDIVDFYRNFTVEVTGVGDVCSFAQMDVRKHGNPQWVSDSETEANQYQQAEDGKTELSLMHFTYTNPEWKPPGRSSAFLTGLRERVQQDANTLSQAPFDNPLATSLHSLTSVGFGQYNSMISSVVAASQPSSHPGGVSSALPSLGTSVSSRASSTRQAPVRGGLKHLEGPLGGSSAGLLSSITPDSRSSAPQQPGGVTFAPEAGRGAGAGRADEQTLELLSTEMCFSALYMHELHQRRVTGGNLYSGQYEEIEARRNWQTPGTATRGAETLDSSQTLVNQTHSLPQQSLSQGGMQGQPPQPLSQSGGMQGGVEMTAPPAMAPILPTSMSSNPTSSYGGVTPGGGLITAPAPMAIPPALGAVSHGMSPSQGGMAPPLPGLAGSSHGLTPSLGPGPRLPGLQEEEVQAGGSLDDKLPLLFTQSPPPPLGGQNEGEEDSSS